MGHKTTPEPDSASASDGGTYATELGCFFLVALFTIGAVWIATATSYWYVGSVAIPGILGGFGQIRWLVIRLAARWRWRRSGVRGVLVCSDSPHWKAHVEEHWLPKVGGQMIVLNWSQRKRWRFSLASEIYWHYCGQNQNYNPAAVILRWFRKPLVFRFFYAFRDARHGNRDALERLEKQLFAELTSPEI